ncbi:cell division protein FtsQ/DivIB [Arthrobacter sp. HY1533]|uniref:cell division protein FtsQ/DivIB n=1 Tax=Arthrobacter sp. HY1533 TaxID=2970919 RepID=UPI0022B9DA94|nr:cell division protein FtsQ/DivIB [Arthrobacter sp. HY1533]
MAEPRRPRVIRTRPGTAAPAGTKAEPDAVEPGAVPAGEPAGAVLATSSKVSVVPVGDPGPAVPKAKEAKAPKEAKSKEPKESKAPRWKLPAGKKAGVPESGAAKNSPDVGAQVLAFPMPEFKRRRRTVLLAAAGVAAVLAIVMAVALFSPALAVKTVVFEGNKLVAPETLNKALAPVMGKPLPQVTGAQVSSLLEPVIQVKGARIEARPPSTLVVHLVERVPVALLKNGGEYLLVDPDGVQLGSTADPASVALPLIDGGKAAIGQDTFVAMTAVLANLPQAILAQLANATAKSPDAVELKLEDGRSVIWGNASDMELKAQVLQALLNAPPPTPEPGKPVPVPAQVFDVSAPRHPVTR